MSTIRFTAHCQVSSCHHFFVVDIDSSKCVRRGKEAFIVWPHPPCPKCGHRGFGTPEYKNVKAVKTETECRSDCWTAKGDVCHCSCGGENHGRAHMLVNLGSDSTRVTPKDMAPA